MIKKAIKVIKHNEVTAVKKPLPSANLDPSERAIRRRRISNVNSWIFERRENRILEKDFSDGVIDMWKSL